MQYLRSVPVNRDSFFTFLLIIVDSTSSQEEKTRIPMITVYSNTFSWRKRQGSVTLVAKLEMGSFLAVKKVVLISPDKCGRSLMLAKQVVAMS